MRRTILRGATALPWSKTPSRTKGTRRNLGDLRPPAVATAIPGPVGKLRKRSRPGRHEESDGCVVPMKPRTTPTDKSGAESVEGRRPVGGKTCGNACSGHSAGLRMSPKPHAYGSEGPGPRVSVPARSRPTFDRSPVRESRTPGSARGAASNRCPYRSTIAEPGALSYGIHTSCCCVAMAKPAAIMAKRFQPARMVFGPGGL